MIGLESCGGSIKLLGGFREVASMLESWDLKCSSSSPSKEVKNSNPDKVSEDIITIYGGLDDLDEPPGSVVSPTPIRRAASGHSPEVLTLLPNEPAPSERSNTPELYQTI